MTEDERSRVMEFLEKRILRPRLFTFNVEDTSISSMEAHIRPMSTIVDMLALEEMRERFAIRHRLGDTGNTVGRDSQHVECDPDRVYQL